MNSYRSPPIKQKIVNYDQIPNKQINQVPFRSTTIIMPVIQQTENDELVIPPS